ncbi:hypothetical protein J8C02_09870 [Chloracidobacterium sp. MS 40/45]|jgi:hypothetical protein|uniref:hypothetical protein n=1 Tax=Chloracidobacterium aggregatum TaxID=2851959 RepID=UPI001B8ABD2D|nr:hypothetical protein [Chloracidobacterium aggregatum]QUV99713.1 hypothetical protein J8C02_09870 [Chloracidobacterium sp. MS 40/45]
MNTLETKTVPTDSAPAKKVFVEPELKAFDQLEKQIQGLRVLEAFSASFLAP